MHCEYCVTEKDYRNATYYSYLFRYSRAFKIALFLLGAFLFYFLGALMKAWSFSYYFAFLAVAYVIWIGIFLYNAEKTVQAYVKNKSNLLNIKYIFDLDGTRIRFRIPEKKADVQFEISKVSCVFELQELFLIYVTMQEVYILPKRALTTEESIALREKFNGILNNRFSSRAFRRVRTMKFGNGKEN